jgi:4-carboxymuconolactone decarboxylase
MPRLPLVDSDATEPDLAAVFDVFRTSGRDVPVLYRVLGNSPRLLRAWTDFAWPLRADATTPRGLRELAILRVAQLTGADFEWHAHAPVARHHGVTDEQLDALSDWSTTELFDPDQRLVLAATDQLTNTLGIDDSTFAALAERWTPCEVVELILTISFYSCVSRVLRGLAIHAP